MFARAPLAPVYLREERFLCSYAQEYRHIGLSWLRTGPKNMFGQGASSAFFSKKPENRANI